MRLDEERESSNFEVQAGGSRGFGGGGGGMLGMLLPLVASRFGCGGIAVLLIIMAVTGGLGSLGSLVGGLGGGGSAPQEQRSGDTGSGELTEVQRWSLRVLGSTERTWDQLFRQQGAQYVPPTLVFYTQSGMSGCGAAQSAMGPFYCPNDKRIYLDTSFFDELRQRFGAPGDFAQAYVIAHEVGHYIQDTTGTLSEVSQRQRRASSAEANALQVRVELQADCYAGVWGRATGLMEPGDVEEGLRAASAIGDDTLQRNAGQRPVPDSFTHGTSEQRMTWLKKGLDSANPAECDTFSGEV